MNKLLRISLMLVMALTCGMGFAQTTITFTAGTDKGADGGNAAKEVTLTKDGVTLKASNASSNGGVFGRNDNYRIYKGATLEVSSTVGNITKVVFTCTASGTSQYGPGCFTTPSTGAYAYSDKVGTWTGDAASFTLTASSAQVRATKIEVTVGGGEVAAVTAPTITGEAEFIDNTTVTITAGDGAKIYYTTDGTDPTDASTLYAAPFTLSETATVKAIAYEGTEKSEVTTKAFTKLAVTQVDNIAAYLGADEGTLVKFNNPVTVTYTDANDTRYLYVKDASGYMLIYNPGVTIYKNGDVIPAGFTGTVGTFSGVRQLAKAAGLQPATETVEAAPEVKTEAEITEALLNAYVKLEKVKVSGVDGRNFTIGNSLAGYNQFNKTVSLDGIDETKLYDVTGIVSAHSGTIQILPTEIVENVTTGVGAVEGAKAVAKVQYVNVAGLQSSEPFDGVNIVVTTYVDGSKQVAKIVK